MNKWIARHAQTIIGWITGFLLLFVAATQFVLSFSNLRLLAIENSVPVDLAALWPLGLDAVVVASSLSVLHSNLMREHNKFAWAIVIVSCVSSIFFNTIAFYPHWLSVGIHATSPILVLVLLELFIRQVQLSIRRHGAVQSLEMLEQTIGRYKMDIAQLEEKSNALSSGTSNEVYSKVARSFDAQPILDFILDKPDATLEQIGRVVGKSKSMAGLYMKTLEGDGTVRRNGHGWEVSNG